MLNELFDKYGSDKGNLPPCPSRGHAYGDFYEKKMSIFVDKPIRLLEIGVCNSDVCHECGARYHGYPRQPHSLLAWRDYLPKAELVGMDNVDFTDFDYDRIEIFCGNQGEPKDLYNTMKNGTFDIIIDDGSHFYIHQIYTLAIMLPLLRRGGLYIVEDILMGQNWSKKGYWAGELEVDNYPYQVGAFITMLNNMGICKAESFDDKFGVYQTIAIEQKE